MDITVTITVLHTALAEPVTYGLVNVRAYLDIKEKNAWTVNYVFIVIQLV